MLGKGYGEPVAMEGALKLKEMSYIHAEGYSGGALKHGPFALIDGEDVSRTGAARDHALTTKIVFLRTNGAARRMNKCQLSLPIEGGQEICTAVVRHAALAGSTKKEKKSALVRSVIGQASAGGRWAAITHR